LRSREKKGGKEGKKRERFASSIKSSITQGRREEEKSSPWTLCAYYQFAMKAEGGERGRGALIERKFSL